LELNQTEVKAFLKEIGQGVVLSLRWRCATGLRRKEGFVFALRPD
jgi:hypothetical protein